MNDSKQQFITISEASKFSGFSQQTIRKMVNKNEIASFKTLT